MLKGPYKLLECIRACLTSGGGGGCFSTKIPSFPPPPKGKEKKEKKRGRERERERERESVYVFGATILDHLKTR